MLLDKVAEDLPEIDRQRLSPITSEDPPDQEGYDIGVSYNIGGYEISVARPDGEIVRTAEGENGRRYRSTDGDGFDVTGETAQLDVSDLTGEHYVRADGRFERPDANFRVRTTSVTAEKTLYDETLQVPPDERITEPAVVETGGRYRIGVTDLTTDEERTAEQYVELTTGGGFCGWFVVRAAHESLAVTVPRCPNRTNESAANESTPDGPTT